MRQHHKALQRVSQFFKNTYLVGAIVTFVMVVGTSFGQHSPDSQSPGSDALLHSEIQRQTQRLTSSDVEERRDALMRLGLIHRVEASQAALSALSDPLPIIRATAANSLSSLPLEASAAALIPLLNDNDEFVRQQVCYALGEMKNRGAVSALIERLETDKLDSVRGAAVVALGRIGDEGAVMPVARVLSRDSGDQTGRKRKGGENEFVLRAAARALGEIGSRAGEPILIGALADTSVAVDVRREAARALGMIGDPAAVPALRGALGESDLYLSHLVIEALHRIASRTPRS